jgi:hypothetical protein
MCKNFIDFGKDLFKSIAKSQLMCKFIIDLDVLGKLKKKEITHEESQIILHRQHSIARNLKQPGIWLEHRWGCKIQNFWPFARRSQNQHL